ncbi:MAG: hypothetical protein IJ002_03170 [Clostridia bacterium]|nr:hypothetical protein [Clostridia bacterium]MBQ8836493.1 hypothetical protein [Clostridia bacterium]
MSYKYQRGGTYSSRNRDEIDKLTEKYTNRGEFEYSPESDEAFKSYAQMMRREGSLAMKDTVGQASALTGGYGNSYAQTAGQQVFNDYISELGAAESDFYDRALSRYNAEGNDILSRIGVLENRETADRAAWEEDYAKDYSSALAKNDIAALAEILGISEEDYKETYVNSQRTPLSEEQIQGYINALQNGDTAKGDYYSYLVNGGYDTDGLLDEVAAKIASGETQGLGIEGEVTYDENGNAEDGRTVKSSYITNDSVNNRVKGLSNYNEGQNFHIQMHENTHGSGDNLEVELGAEVTDNAALTNKAKSYTGLLADGNTLYYMANGRVYKVEPLGWGKADEYNKIIEHMKSYKGA